MEIKRRDVLCYLRYKGQEISQELDDKINQAIDICAKNVHLKYILKKYRVNRQTKMIEGTTLKLEGNSIWKHIEGCDEVYLLGATIGFEVEKLIAKYFISDRTLAVILDAAATAAIESYCDEICENIKEKITSRFSCGYGDWNIAVQNELCRVLDTQRQIGVFCNQAHMLTPQKSVTALMGIKNEC